MLMHRYQKAVDNLFAKVRETQTETILKAGELIAQRVAAGNKIYLAEICHKIQHDLIYRGGGPIFYKAFDIEQGADLLKEGDVLIVSSVSGRTKKVVDFAWDAMQKGVNVIAFISMEYASQVEPVHESGKKLYEFVTLAVDNCAPAAEAMLEVDGIEARFSAASGIASDYIMWNITCVVVEKMLEMGLTPGILKSANFPGGPEYNKEIEAHYEEFGW